MNPGNIRRLALIGLACLASACSLTRPKLEPGELGRQFTATVPGTWAGDFSGNGTQCRMIKQFHPDGSAKGVLILKRKQNGVTLVLPEIPFTSRWRVTGDMVETYAVKTGVTGMFRKDEVIRDEILSVSNERIVSRSTKTGEIEIITRLSAIR